MSNYKYPFIPNKRMYAAVMGACSYIRDKGYFNKAVSYYADKYNVDEEELAQHIRARQAAWQKGKKSNNAGKKYKWFIVCRTSYCDANYDKSYSEPEILKGLTAESVTGRYSKADWDYTMRNDYGGSYAPIVDHVAIAEFETEAEAKKALLDWEKIAKEYEDGRLS